MAATTASDLKRWTSIVRGGLLVPQTFPMKSIKAPKTTSGRFLAPSFTALLSSQQSVGYFHLFRGHFFY